MSLRVYVLVGLLLSHSVAFLPISTPSFLSRKAVARHADTRCLATPTLPQTMRFHVPSESATSTSSIEGRQPFIETSPESSLEIDNVNYVVGTPVDYPIFLCQIGDEDGAEVVYPVEIDVENSSVENNQDYPAMDRELLLAVEEVVRADLGGGSSDVGVLWTPTSLTVVGVDLDEAFGGK